ncbi:MAG: ParB/RepB/Spo0J family partition protein [Atribacterota bacterium]|nr:ParB/RepB/Spo0J family partition protein [Atribacterota bacterium]
MTKKKEVILRKFAKDTFDSLPIQEEEMITKEKKGIREGTKGLSGARIIEISRIKLDPEQPRKSLNQKRLNELAESIKKHGLLQPISVEYIEAEDCFKIISGERRYKAAKLSDLQELPCIIKNIDSNTRLIHQLIENIQRQNLPPLEEAESIQALINKKRMDNPSYSQREASRELGLPKSYVNEMLSLLKLPQDIKESVRTSDTVPKSLLLLLLRQSNKINIREFYRQIKEGTLTVREAKSELKKSKDKKGRPKYYEYKFESPGREFVLKIKFRKPEVEQSEITNAILQVLNILNK